MCVFSSMHMCLPVVAKISRGQKKASDLLKPELQKVVSCQVSARN